MRVLKFLVLLFTASLGLSTEAAVKLTLYQRDAKTSVELAVFDGMEITVDGNSLKFAGQDNGTAYIMEDILRFEYADGKPGLVDNVTADSDIKLVPGGIMIGEIGAYTLRVYDASGRLAATSVSDGEQFVSTADLMSGIYFIEVTSGNNSVKLKIQKR